MIKCLAIDDEPLALKQISSYIKEIPEFELVGACTGAASAGKILDEQGVDVIFVDINMPDVNGMDFVKSLQSPPMIVFTTAYSDYAVEGFKVDAVDYLLKPFGMDEFRHTAVKVIRLYQMAHSTKEAPVMPSDESIFFKTDYKIVRVEVGKIIYVEGMSEYLKIHVEGVDDPYVVLLSMKKMEDNLPSERFMRIHKSYIINLSKIREVSKGRVLMSNEVSLPIGDTYRDSFNEYLESKFLGR